MLNLRTESPPLKLMTWFLPNLVTSLCESQFSGCLSKRLLSFLHWLVPFIHWVCRKCDSHSWKTLHFWCQRVKASWISMQWYTATILFLLSGLLSLFNQGTGQQCQHYGFVFFLLGLSFWHMWILFYIKWKDFFLVSDDGFKMKQGICFWCGSDPGLCWDSCILVTCTFFFDLSRGVLQVTSFI
jgi:hypothetical protein